MMACSDARGTNQLTGGGGASRPHDYKMITVSRPTTVPTPKASSPFALFLAEPRQPHSLSRVGRQAMAGAGTYAAPCPSLPSQIPSLSLPLLLAFRPSLSLGFPALHVLRQCELSAPTRSANPAPPVGLEMVTAVAAAAPLSALARGQGSSVPAIAAGSRAAWATARARGTLEPWRPPWYSR